MDTISFGPGRTPRRWRPGWLRRGRQPRSAGPGRWTWLFVATAVTAGAVTAIALVTAIGGGPRPVTARSPSTPASPSTAPPPFAEPMPSLLTGLPADRVSTDMFLGGENFWQLGRQPRAVASGFLVNGLSPLLPPGHGAEVDQLAPVPGGVVAHISDISTGITYGALGRVVFIPDANAPARVIARATMIAVPPDGRQVWVQTAIQSGQNGEGVPASFRSPTWAVNLAGRRVSPVLELPFGLVAATASGPLTENLNSGQMQLWNGATGRPIPLPPSLPADTDFVAAGRDRVIWSSCLSSCYLHVTDLDTGANADVTLPANWLPASQGYPPPPASFDPSGVQLVLPLDRVDSAGNAVAEDLFVADTATGTLRMIPGQPLPLPSSLVTAQPVQLVAAWDRQGLLWVLATSPDSGYYQLAFWTGSGPLRTFAPARGSPVVLSAPGSGRPLT
ncbi:MAG TPA: hypothetical protein VIY52_11090 [Streptosporangiaceae bacterium]